jgi:hypothetical protein
MKQLSLKSAEIATAFGKPRADSELQLQMIDRGSPLDSQEPSSALSFLTPMVRRIEHALEKVQEAERTRLTHLEDGEASVSERTRVRPRFDLD